MTDHPRPARTAPPAPPRRQPFRCSALYRRQLALGATMVEHAGWRTAGHFTGVADEARRVRDGAGLGDVSWLGKLDLRYTQTDGVLARLERALGFPPSPPLPGSLADAPARLVASTRAGAPGGAGGLAPVLPRRVWPLARGQALVTCVPGERAGLAQRLLAAGDPPASCLHLTDVTSVYAALLLAGPGSREILRTLTAVDVGAEALPAGRAVQGGLAHVHAILLREDLGPARDVPGYWLLVGREYGEYLWETVLHAGRRLGIAPFGVGALGRPGGGHVRGLPQLFAHDRMWRTHDLKRSYDVVIVGAGVHGLATAYYLARDHGIRRIALLERRYLGAGNSGRNTAIIRANYRTREGIPFYARSVELYEQLSADLKWNVLFTQCGHLTLAHTESSITGLRVRAEMNRLLGVDSRMIGPEEIARLVPAMDLGQHAHLPVLAALYHPPGGIIRHDAVVWGYARACDRLGVEIHPYTEATGITVDGKALDLPAGGAANGRDGARHRRPD